MNTVTAGRELDALVAEKVMQLEGVGRYHRFDLSVRQWERCDHYLGADFYCEPDAAGTPFRSVPCYSTRIEDAWLVVMKLNDHDFVLEWQGEQNWHCDMRGACVHGQTAPEAICKAALQASQLEP